MPLPELEVGLGMPIEVPEFREFPRSDPPFPRTNSSDFGPRIDTQRIRKKLAHMSKRGLLLGLWHEGVRWGVTAAVLTGAIKVEGDWLKTLAAGGAYVGALGLLTVVEALRRDDVLNPAVEAMRIGSTALGAHPRDILPRIATSLPNKLCSLGAETLWNSGGELVNPGLSSARLLASATTVIGEALANLVMRRVEINRSVQASGITKAVEGVL